jgi:hypothetical protein
MLLFGSAVGISIADATDLEAVGKGLGIAAGIWLVITALVAYFLGGWLAGWLSGETVKSVGMLHGVTVWGASIVWMLFLSYVGMSGLAQTGKAVLGGATKAGTALISTATAGAGVAGAKADELENSPIMNQIQALLKRRASELAAQANVPGGAEVSPEEVRRAIDQLDAQALQAAAVQLLQGNTEAAKNVMAVNTNLSEAQIDEIVDGVATELKQDIEKYKAEAAKRMESLSSYTQAVIWVMFVSNCLGLVLAIIGGWLGVHSVHHFYVLHRRKINP